MRIVRPEAWLITAHLREIPRGRSPAVPERKVASLAPLEWSCETLPRCLGGVTQPQLVLRNTGSRAAGTGLHFDACARTPLQRTSSRLFLVRLRQSNSGWKLNTSRRDLSSNIKELFTPTEALTAPDRLRQPCGDRASAAGHKSLRCLPCYRPRVAPLVRDVVL
jgi:hypothetical protein